MTSWLDRVLTSLCGEWGRPAPVQPEPEPEPVEDDSVRATEVRAARRNIGVAAALHQAEISARRRP